MLEDFLQFSSGQYEDVFPSLDHRVPRLADKPKPATKCSGPAPLVAGPGLGAVSTSLLAVQSPRVSVCSSAGRKWSHHSWNDCLSTVPPLVSSCRHTGPWVPALFGPPCCSSQPWVWGLGMVPGFQTGKQDQLFSRWLDSSTEYLKMGTCWKIQGFHGHWRAEASVFGHLQPEFLAWSGGPPSESLFLPVFRQSPPGAESLLTVMFHT